MYEEHAKNQLPKLKRTYWQKCQIVEVSHQLLCFF